MDIPAQLQAIDGVSLAALVAQAIRRPVAKVASWSIQPIQGGVGESLGVYRISGQLEDRGDSIAWSLILKVLGRPDHGGEQPDWNYWKRDALAYQSGLLDLLPHGLAAPCCFGVVEQADDTLWLWLEEIVERPGAWTLADYGQAAFRLGQFNAAYLTGRPLPDDPWLSRDWLRRWVEDNADAMAQFRSALDHPVVRRMCPADVADGILRSWAERDWFLKVPERLPQTVCHLDVFRRNLLARPEQNGDFVLLDWAFTGQVAVGEEMVPMVHMNLVSFEVEMRSASDLEEGVLAGYVSGLRDAGWQSDPRLARLGYAAAGALRFCAGHASLVLALRDERTQSVFEQLSGHPIGEICDTWAEVQRRLTLPLANEAVELAQRLGV